MVSQLQVLYDEYVAERPTQVIGADVRFAESLAATLITEFTLPGDVVFDPFAGYGTTLVVAQRLGRRAVGVETLPDRVAVARKRAGESTLIMVGDIRERLNDVPAALQLCLTSPPYMTATNHPESPLTGYRRHEGDYETYLRDLSDIFGDIGTRLCQGGRLVVNVADQLDPAGRFTPLVSDLTAAVCRHLQLVEQVPVKWDRRPAGLTNDSCLVFAPRSVAGEANNP